MISNSRNSDRRHFSSWRDQAGRRVDAPARPRKRVSLLEFNSAPDGFVPISEFLSRNFSDPDRPELAAIRKRKAAERLDRDGFISLAYLRMCLGLSQRQLSERIGSSQASIARLEAGSERPSFEKLCKLQDVLQVSFDKLVEAISNVPDQR